ncbi:hypothetical protein BJY16_007389 [Actinoplanes octamycinicus]|uniref:DUF4192 domain-containing protein n=1 Tax=Actinoplanes octamycinicus TaxID=135948 RepID=A0A7W7H4L7_9ACTN|nr:DUF4192 domain-containing protein [Actinoplanes octamycinicus]MBB4743930.1 hypothetical protein [Actinoplanes octamycinicus]GIE58556.1 hypothetical protein Aoc01nite_39580 [Actinoplanes octamycinicus]
MQRPFIRLSNPTEAATVVPYLLGYQPHNSLTFLAIDNGTVGCAGAQELPDGPDYRHTAHDLAHVLLANDMTEVMLIGYGPREPMQQAIEQAIDVFEQAGVTVLQAMRVGEDQVWHVGCDEPDCKIKGLPYDPSTSIVAATATYAGVSIAPDRDALAARLAPVTGDERQRMRTAVRAALRSGRLPMHADTAAELVATLLDEAVTAATTRTRLSDDRAALLLLLLTSTQLREAAITRVHGTTEQVQVWTDLTRRAGSGQLAATPALYLALAALQRGDGVTAALAAHRACEADPDDEFADLFRRAIHAGISPEALRRTLHDD